MYTIGLPVNITEVFTPTGWLPLEKLKIGDNVAIYDIKQQRTKFKKVKYITDVIQAQTVVLDKITTGIDNLILFNHDNHIIESDIQEILLSYNTIDVLSTDIDDICKITYNTLDLSKFSSSITGIVSIHVTPEHLIVKQNDFVFIISTI